MVRPPSTCPEIVAALLLVALNTWAPTSAVEAAPWTKPRDLPPSEVGRWDGPYDWPVVAIHAFLLPTGKVLHFSFPGGLENPNAFVWDPATWEFTPVPVNRPLFCSGHSFMADGRLLVAGGTGPAPEGEIRGIRDAHIFDPFDETWSRVADMAEARWYPTNVALADGRVLVFSGLISAPPDGPPENNLFVELYESGVGVCWQIVAEEVRLPLYPWTHLLSSGDVFYSGPSWETGVFSTDTWSWYGIVRSNNGWRGGGMSVLLPQIQDRVMVVGGQSEVVVTATAEIIDLTASAPQWRFTRPMNFPRMHANAVILPDGKILVIGGHSEMHEGEGDGPPPSSVYEAEMFDPAAETWTLMAGMQVARVYHSTALLLPDGRVLAGGSTGIGPPGHSTEIYSPPYLFRGPPPVIAAAPTHVAYGEPFEIESPNAPDIESVVLIRLSSVTHSVNMDQRYVALDFIPSPEQSYILLAQAPFEPAVAPPGSYMLFLLNADKVSSAAKMVRLGGIPDGYECERVKAPQSELDVVAKNRYLTFVPPEPCQYAAIRVTFVDLPAPFDVLNGETMWVGEPQKVCENAGQGPDVPPESCGPAGGLSSRTFWSASLQCEPYYTDWNAYGTVHAYHESIVPGGTYAIQSVLHGCELTNEGNYSSALTMTQAKWGDLCSDGPGGACTGAADGNPEVIQDVLGLINKFQNINALQKSRADLVPSEVDLKVTIIGDALFALDAFQGFAYPFTPGDPCGPG